MVETQVVQLRNTLVGIVQNDIITNLAKRNLSEERLYATFRTYLSDDIRLVKYDCQEAISREEAERRVSQRFYSIPDEQQYNANEHEIFGSHKDLRYRIAKDKNAFFVRLLNDSYGMNWDIEMKYIQRAAYEVEINCAEMSSELLFGGKFNEDLVKIISKYPTFDPEAMLKGSIINGIKKHIEKDLMGDSLVHKLFVRGSLGIYDLYWNIRCPSYLDRNPTWEGIARFDKEALYYIQNTMALVKMLFADEPNIESGLDRVKLSPEDNDKLYQSSFDEVYFKRRGRKIKSRKWL